MDMGCISCEVGNDSVYVFRSSVTQAEAIFDPGPVVVSFVVDCDTGPDFPPNALLHAIRFVGYTRSCVFDQYNKRIIPCALVFFCKNDFTDTPYSSSF